MIPHIQTPNALVITGRTGTPVSVSSAHQNFGQIVDLVKSVSNADESTYDLLDELIYPVVQLKKVAQADDSYFYLDEYNVLSCKVYGKNFVLPTSLGKTILALYNSKGDLTPFVRFVEKLSKNPDPEVITQLWDFISACGLCLDTDGNFLAYKNVRSDFTSIHDSKTDNTPGTVVKMKRKDVEKNANKTCSRGLHFAAWEYLNHFYASGSKTVLVSVSPKDVVSIPSDYNFQKGRACRYKIVREVAQPKELDSIVLFEEKEDSEYTSYYDDSDYYDYDDSY